MKITVHQLNDIEIDGKHFNAPEEACKVGGSEVGNAILVYEGELLKKVADAASTMSTVQHISDSCVAGEKAAKEAAQKAMAERDEAIRVRAEMEESMVQERKAKEGLNEEVKALTRALSEVESAVLDPATPTETAALSIINSVRGTPQERELKQLEAHRSQIEAQMERLKAG